jgi:hypothetical protein
LSRPAGVPHVRERATPARFVRPLGRLRRSPSKRLISVRTQFLIRGIGAAVADARRTSKGSENERSSCSRTDSSLRHPRDRIRDTAAGGRRGEARDRRSTRSSTTRRRAFGTTRSCTRSSSSPRGGTAGITMTADQTSRTGLRTGSRQFDVIIWLSTIGGVRGDAPLSPTRSGRVRALHREPGGYAGIHAASDCCDESSGRGAPGQPGPLANHPAARVHRLHRAFGGSCFQPSW